MFCEPFLFAQPCADDFRSCIRRELFARATRGHARPHVGGDVLAVAAQAAAPRRDAAGHVAPPVTQSDGLSARMARQSSSVSSMP